MNDLSPDTAVNPTDLPWFMPPLPQSPEATNARDVLLLQRARELSRSREIWSSRWTSLTMPPPGTFGFDLAAHVPAVVGALKVDPFLRSAR